MNEKKALLGLVDIALLILIILNILDFFNLSSVELDFVQRIMSWTLLGSLLFQVSLTKIFFGKKEPFVDVLLIFSFFFLIVKDFIWFAKTALAEKSLLQYFFFFFVKHAIIIEQLFFVMGIFMLVCLGLYVTWRVPFAKRSIMGVLHEEGNPQKNKLLERCFMTLLVFFGFFVMVFNMMMEWLAMAIDATIILLGLLFWSVLLIRHKVSVHKFIDKASNFADEKYEWFLDHFRYKETFLLGIVGLLILHLLTDLGVFFVSYLTGIRDPLYAAALSVKFETVWEVLAAHLAGADFLLACAVIVMFCLNIVGYLLLFCSPVLIWYALFERRHPVLPKWLLILFFASIPAITFGSLFSVRRLNTFNLLGVGIELQTMATSPIVSIGIALFCIVFLLVAVLLCKEHKWFVKLSQLWVAASIVFFSQYIILFFLDVAVYQQAVVFDMLQQQFYFFALIFFIFQTLLILFYVGGLIILFYELGHRTMHKSKNIQKENIFKK